ncbi:hypothetical protein A2866_06615 [Candidatus Roizmanbacteria bacterium RIFCSPHIGHO2_01_FULL_39_8]|uniref:DUF3850 domain-containing protein n=3 Tax=Candidatus Roizmaniibacteriota TaxID=1752723 RepID=A0A1F7GGZ3_9BACT|nr:MAG: hypothetical protein A2866_06615 [Candidatus Roizmanbacteria bacterium RIFCSPHIGHO2_01_FULL_39_8]OGK27569.1 MAG: hypothetical protein A3C28_06080 [Candidatus Roizmanbacteria bacterium RIFCSPHIGHO2_02_FULL_39_9]OGK36650.1 MAG: hypothetical protein A3F60_01075 [Candidatus Roizmanbacteria bacterium RIFCSPHIGHO2_12_FULL_39_8]
MKIVDSNIPKKYFTKDRNNRLEARLAKFEVEKGDVIRFHEVDDNGQRTGRYFDKKIKDLHKIHKATKYWSKKDLKKYGIYVFELSKI